VRWQPAAGPPWRDPRSVVVDEPHPKPVMEKVAAAALGEMEIG